MDGRALIAALSLFAGLSLMPAVFVILRDKQIPLDARRPVTGVGAVLAAAILLALALLYLLNVVAQDLALLAGATLALLGLPPLLILLGRRRKADGL